MNNIFDFATKELSQDAFLAWSINWLNFPKSHSLYNYGKAMLDLFLGSQKSASYTDVLIQRQPLKIDVLVLFKDADDKPHALIIEDKTNTSEHSNQLNHYADSLRASLEKNEFDYLENYKSATIHLAYIKTGIMYDEDRDKTAGAEIVDIDKLYHVLSAVPENASEILNSFKYYIEGKINDNKKVETLIKSGNYEEALKTAYGQFLFLDKVFPSRKITKEPTDNYIYPVSDRSGYPFTEYSFWHAEYPNKTDNNKNENSEYHYLLWRIGRKHIKRNPYIYISLRHYDELAHSTDNDWLNRRKQIMHNYFINSANELRNKYLSDVSEVKSRDTNKASELMCIPMSYFSGKSIDEVKALLNTITEVMASCFNSDAAYKELHNMYK